MENQKDLAELIEIINKHHQNDNFKEMAEETLAFCAQCATLKNNTMRYPIHSPERLLFCMMLIKLMDQIPSELNVDMNSILVHLAKWDRYQQNEPNNPLEDFWDKHENRTTSIIGFLDLIKELLTLYGVDNMENIKSPPADSIEYYRTYEDVGVSEWTDTERAHYLKHRPFEISEEDWDILKEWEDKD